MNDSPELPLSSKKHPLFLSRHLVSRIRKKLPQIFSSTDSSREVIALMREGVGVVDLDENITFANSAFAEIFGIDATSLIWQNLLSFIEPESLNYLKSETKKRKTGEDSEYELIIRRPDGGRRNIRVRAVPHTNKDGIVTGSIGVLEDITEKKKLERAQKAIIEIYTAFLQGSQDQDEEDFEQTLSNIHEILITADLFDATNLNIAIMNPETDELHFAYYADQYTDNPRIIHNPKNDTVLHADVIREGDPRVLHKEEITALYPNYQHWDAIPEVLMILPLKTNTGILWTLLLQSYFDADAYVSADIDILASIANKIADVIAQKIEVKKRRELERIQKVVLAINQETLATDNQQELFSRIHDSMQSVLPDGKATNFYICLIEKKDPENLAESLVSYPYFYDELDAPPIWLERLGNCTTSGVIKTWQLIHIPLEKVETIDTALDIHGTGTEPEDWLGVPLYYEHEVIGAMVVQIYTQKWLRYTKKDEHILQTIASQITLAIQKKRSMDLIEEERSRYKWLTEWLPIGVGVFDEKENFLLENPELKMLFWIATEDSLIGRNLLDFIHPDDKKIVRENTLARKKWESSTYEVRMTWADGELRIINIKASPEKYRGEFQILSIIRDVTDEKAREEQLIQDAMHDDLTGLWSFRALQERLLQEFDKYRRIDKNGASGKFTVGFVDVDNLKIVNDTISHDIGSQLICDVANILRSIDRKMDGVFRIWWDEFIIILPECSEQNAENVIVPRILSELEKINTIRKAEHFERYSAPDYTGKIPSYHNMSISIGFSEFNPAIHQVPDDVRNEADQKMYIRKFTKKSRRAWNDGDYKLSLERAMSAYNKNSRAKEVRDLLVFLSREIPICASWISEDKQKDFKALYDWVEEHKFSSTQ